jgi:hypothetical protein
MFLSQNFNQHLMESEPARAVMPINYHRCSLQFLVLKHCLKLACEVGQHDIQLVLALLKSSVSLASYT